MAELKNAADPVRAAILVSGSGTNLQALIDAQLADDNCPYYIAVVISDRPDIKALDRAKNANIPTAVITPPAEMKRAEQRQSISDAILEICRSMGIDFIVYAGFLTILSGDIVTEYKNRMINLHPALLPKFGGKGMWGHHVHEAVLASGDTESGCTIHLVDSGCDTGRILLQRTVPVIKGDTPDTLAARIAPEEHKAIVEGTLLLARELQAQ